jgi:hypothetical protein
VTGWDLCIGGFMRHYSGWLIRGQASGFGFTAQQRNEDGLPRGPVLTGRDLDELASRIETAQPIRPRARTGPEFAGGGSPGRAGQLSC